MNISRTDLPTFRSVLPLVGSSGLEPPTSRLSGARSNHLSYEPIQFPRCISSLIPTRRFRLRQLAAGGDDGNRTHDPLLAGQVLSQLSYTPVSLRGELNNLYGHSKLNNNKLILAFRLTLSLAVFFWFLLYSILTISSHITCAEYLVLHRKEVIQPHLPIRLPCYDLTPIIEPTFDCCLLAVSSQASGVPNFHGLTGGVYKARERIHRGMLIRDY